ncbi:MAG: sulfite exporter TauE/SafE family protein [Tepidibacter sp.]|jgi:uncharacterized membrane protein YfcA|uniref:sulfite exporter TauE/SafE family protein n=1 Tax=Tepidibacter sp. TaxID=2529387 RepID=UPI0025EF6F54|nr:sulfite exporter TauE/SafE family protein [Tepidibacter sp.]MCT4507807.1 sulfite exporter TauE/SafE family protein [Tepidibacter sp.]
MINIVLGVLGVLTLWFAVVLILDFIKNKDNLEEHNSWGKVVFIGFITDFFDTLGIGSFAPTTALLKGMKQVQDRLLPGTLNAAHTIPVVLEAFIFMTVIKVDPITLVSMLVAATIGAYVGAGIVSRLPEKKVQFVMGIALFITAFLMLAGKMDWMPGGGQPLEKPFDGVKNSLVYKTLEIEETEKISEAGSLKIKEIINTSKTKEMSENTKMEAKQVIEKLGLEINGEVINHKIKEVIEIKEVKDGEAVKQMVKFKRETGIPIGVRGLKLIIAVIANFILGALMTAGIGLYAPCMALVYFLGMSQIIAFPVMMGSCAFLMPVASVKFVKEKAIDRRASIGITIGGVVGVIIAAKFVSGLDIETLKWLVIIVIFYTSITMIKVASKNKELVN